MIKQNGKRGINNAGTCWLEEHARQRNMLGIRTRRAHRTWW